MQKGKAEIHEEGVRGCLSTLCIFLPRGLEKGKHTYLGIWAEKL